MNSWNLISRWSELSFTVTSQKHFLSIMQNINLAAEAIIRLYGYPPLTGGDMVDNRTERTNDASVCFVSCSWLVVNGVALHT